MNKNKKRKVSLSRLRKPVDTFTPSVGRLYRSLRDVAVAHESIDTSYGFRLAGDPRMAGEGFETNEVKIFAEMLEDYDTVLDIGANIGFYTCLAATRGKPVISFEPSSRNLQFLYRNIWENNLKNVEVFPLGLGKHSGVNCLYGFGGISSFVPGWAQAENYTLVPMTTLDTVIASRLRNKKLLIKLDVEGFELDVLAGAQETLQFNPKPSWLVEILLEDGVIPGGVNNRFAEVFETLWGRGYRSTKLDAKRQTVQAEDVSRWCAAGEVDGGTHNFLFY